MAEVAVVAASLDVAVVAAACESDDADVAASSTDEATEDASTAATISDFAISLFSSSVISISLLPSEALVSAPLQPTIESAIEDAISIARACFFFMSFSFLCELLEIHCLRVLIQW